MRELRRRALAATPGPWVISKSDNPEIVWLQWGRNRGALLFADDAAYIAAANPAAILALLDELGRAEEKGRREAVERIKDRLLDLRQKDARGFLGIKFGELFLLLDEEAAR